MQISSSMNDQLMIMAAHGFCLRRNNYIVDSCLEFLTEHWDQLTDNTQFVILRDTVSAILDHNTEIMSLPHHFVLPLSTRWAQFVSSHIGKHRQRLHDTLASRVSSVELELALLTVPNVESSF